MQDDSSDELEHDDEADELDSSGLATEADVTCPYCGETVTIALDPNGGAEQEYIEDCQVCCQPWQVHVSYAAEGTAEVTVAATG